VSLVVGTQGFVFSGVFVWGICHASPHVEIGMAMLTDIAVLGLRLDCALLPRAGSGHDRPNLPIYAAFWHGRYAAVYRSVGADFSPRFSLLICFVWIGRWVSIVEYSTGDLTLAITYA
jgi:hypothetical protein